jgi:membrane carboxypeptidase/penicillin-binding protein
MAEDGYITQEQADQAKQEVLKYALSKTDIKAPHFVFYVRDWLYDQYGVETVEKGGLRVTTTLDLGLQEAAQASLSAEVEDLQRLNVGNGAAIIAKPNTGEILAMIGSKDYFNEEEDGQVNVALSFRQPGSSIKPVMYALAFQNKLLNPGSILLDVPTCFTVPGQKPYCPKNYDGSFKGPVTIRQSLGNSLNIPAVKGLQIIGLVRFIEQARQLGITTWEDPSKYGLSLTLGGGEVRMIDMVQVFSTIANQGVKVPLTPILKVEDYQGNVLKNIDPEQRKSILAEMNLYEDETEIDGIQRVMDRAPAYLTSHIMQDNNARLAAFGPRSELVIPNQIVSAKTGTTNDLKDNWTVGFTPEFLVITWVGNNDGSPMNPYLVSGVTGAAPIWNDIMSFILRDQPPIIPSKPGNVLSAGVCANGMPPQGNNNCKVRYQELYWANSTPSASLEYTKEIWVKSDTGTPPAPGEQADNLVLETHTVVSDPTTPYYCLDCRQAVNEEGKPVYQRQTVPNDYQPSQTPQL